MLTGIYPKSDIRYKRNNRYKRYIRYKWGIGSKWYIWGIWDSRSTIMIDRALEPALFLPARWSQHYFCRREKRQHYF